MVGENLQQFQTPLLDALGKCIQDGHAAFYTPGHKRGMGIDGRLRELLGEKLFFADLSELSELDNLAAPSGAIASSQCLAAAAFGANYTFFLVNGSTCGIVAAIMATCNPGDKIILPRHIHASVISGLIMTGAVPIFIQSQYDTQFGIPYGITVSDLALTLSQHPDAKAVMVVYPSYEGLCGDIRGFAELTHSYGIPLLVDEAHGSHFCFHPQLPISALAGGADLSVQSIHKTLGAMTQGSMLHGKGDLIDLNRLQKTLRMVQSTSPSYILMAGLDAARYQMATMGLELMERALSLANFAREQIAKIPGLLVLETPVDSIDDAVQKPELNTNLNPKSKIQNPKSKIQIDPTRLTVIVSPLGITGFTADDFLETKYGVRCEFSSLHYLTFIITFGNTPADIEKLITGLTALTNLPTSEKDTYLLNSINTKVLTKNFTSINQQLVITPRDAFFAATETIEIIQVCDRICAETICPYPPGIPILLPGEFITAEALEYLQTVKSLGGSITGCADPSLQTLQVVKQ